MLLDALRMEFDQEAATTARFLERLPADKLGWKPQEQAMTLGALAGHLAMLPGWGALTTREPAHDIPGDYVAPEMNDPAAILAKYTEGATELRAALAAASEDQLMEPWTLSKGGQTIFTLPRAAALRMVIFNHLIHHRAQLGVYYRLLGVPVPSAYGPSGDEGPKF